MQPISLGQYTIRCDAGSLVVTGGDEVVSRRATDLLFDLLGSAEGASLLGKARLGVVSIAGQHALSQLAKRIGVPFEVTQTSRIAFRPAGRALDYDQDHARIRALNLPKIYTRTITEFEGMCAAIVFDGILDDNEFEMLRCWMAAKKEFLDAWPLCDVRDFVAKAMADGVVDDAERQSLMQLLDSIGASAENCGAPAPSIFDEQPEVTFPGRSFLFTGGLAMGPRKNAEGAVLQRGGKVVSSVSQRLNYLVVGDLGTDAWQFSRYGRKIEAVMENKRAGGETIVVREGDFEVALRG